MSEPVFAGAAWFKNGPWREFQGRVQNGQCRLPFRVRGFDVEHVAVIDTGFPGMMLARHVATSCNLPLSLEDFVEVHGIGQGFRRVPTTTVDLALSPARGDVLNLRDVITVDDLPSGTDMLLGESVLGYGTFTLDGPRGIWTWRVRDADLARGIAAS